MRTEASRLPEEFLERLHSIFPVGRFDALVNTFTQSKPTTFRVNTLIGRREEVLAQLKEAGFGLAPVSWFGEAFALRQGTLRELQEHALYRDGKIYVQNLSSMIPPLLLDPRAGEKILDLTAAPGSKTSEIVCLMGGQGEVMANDNNRTRFFKLLATLKNQTCTTVQAVCHHGESMGRRFPAAFDRVLLDAPCSAEGRFRANEPRSYRYWKVRKVDEMARKQRRLFAAAVGALKPGGVLVYSTCTFAPEENEGVLSWAYEKFEGVLSASSVWQDWPPLRALGNVARPLAGWEGKPFHRDTALAARILPSESMEGFFVAKLRKKAAAA